MVTKAPLDRAAVARAVADVVDPELPAVTIGMLGMVHHVAVDDADVHVELLPTFAGCPATDMIRRDVVAAVGDLDGVERVKVEFRFEPAWTPDRIDEEGRRRLSEFGIAPPRGGPSPAGETVPDGVVALPLAPVAQGRECPWCGSTDTVRDGMFGPTPCRDVWHCASCQQPFEGFKN